MPADFPEAYEHLEEVARKLEEPLQRHAGPRVHHRGRPLYMLQTRTGKRTGPAAVRIAVEMAEEGLIEPQEALLRVEPDSSTSCWRPLRPRREQGRRAGRLLAKGLPAGPGAASGRIALTAERAAEMAERRGAGDAGARGDLARGHRRHARRRRGS